MSMHIYENDTVNQLYSIFDFLFNESWFLSILVSPDWFVHSKFPSLLHQSEAPDQI